MFRTTVAVTALALVTVTQSFGGVAIVLVDDLRLTGKTLQRRGDDFLLEIEE